MATSSRNFNSINILPKDGDACKISNVMVSARSYLNILLRTLPFAERSFTVKNGERLVIPNTSCYYGLDEGEYTDHNGIRYVPMSWGHDTQFSRIKSVIESFDRSRGDNFTSYTNVLVEKLANGLQSIPSRSFKEPEIVKESTIAMIFFGQPRKIIFEHIKTGETVPFVIGMNTVIYMMNETQQFWKHYIPKQKQDKIVEPTVILTFTSKQRVSL